MSVNPLVGKVDCSRWVEMDLDAACLERHCPPVLCSILGSKGLLFDAEVDLRLVGKVTLLSASVSDLLVKLLRGPDALRGVSLNEVFEVVVDQAFDPGAPVPQWANGRADLLRQLGECLLFTGARIIGHVHQGLGGGVEASVGASAEIIGRAEGGALIDVPVSESDLNLVQMGLSTNSSAA